MLYRIGLCTPVDCTPVITPMVRHLILHVATDRRKKLLGLKLWVLGFPWWLSCLPIQETWVWSLIWEDPTCHGAAKPMHHNYWACALESGSCNYLTHIPQLLKPVRPGAQSPQQEKPPQWEACAPRLEGSPFEQQQKPSKTHTKKNYESGR